MTTETAPTFKTDAIGIPGEPVSFIVERERVAVYAAATNDPIAAHAAGDIASPVFSIVPAFQSAAQASVALIPPELIGAILHGEQDFHFHRPIEPGMVLESVSTPIGIRQRSSGVTVVVHCESRNQSGELVGEQYMTSFVRGAKGVTDVGEVAPEHAFPPELAAAEPIARVAQTFDGDQTYRYSEASGDPMPIHLDDEFAKSVGLPGIIIHGLCSMAFASVALLESVSADDPTRLKRLAVRFASIALPEQTITTRVWDAGERGGRHAYAFATESDAGATVIKDGWAELA